MAVLKLQPISTPEPQARINPTPKRHPFSTGARLWLYCLGALWCSRLLFRVPPEQGGEAWVQCHPRRT